MLLLREMSEAGVVPDTICYNCAISACAHANRPEQASTALSQLRHLQS